MLQEFVQNRKKLSQCQGLADEYVVLKKNSRSSSRFTQNNIFGALLQDDTVYTNGLMLTIDGHKYFVVTRRDNVLSKTAQLYKANCSTSIVTIKKHYTSGTFDYYTESPAITVVALQKDITGKMQQFDAGLLPNTVKKFILKADVKLLDRIKLDEKNYQVNVVNSTEYEGLLEVQCSEDTRVTK